MKNTLTIAFGICIIFLMIFTIQLYRGYQVLEETLKIERLQLQMLNEQQGIIFIWNDDFESIPEDGSLITLELTEENTVYIGPYDPTAKTN